MPQHQHTKMENRQAGVCNLCLNEKAKYTCPRCNLQYCSLECYKSEKHVQCSENFYKDCFIEGLKDLSTSKDERQKILEMLKRVQEEDPGVDSDDEDDLQERLEGLDLDHDTQAVWNRLSEKEKKEFEKLAGGGELSALVDVWTPWWKEKVLVTEVDREEKMVKGKQPEIRENIPDITSLLKGKPSAEIRNNVINVLYSYCYVCRLYNGDHASLAVDAAKVIVSTSSVLRENAVCSCPAEAVQLCFQCLQNNNRTNQTSQQYSISVIEDVTSIIQGPSHHDPLRFIMAALSDLSNLFQGAVKELSLELKQCKEETKKSEMKHLKKSFFTVLKKLEFMLSWSHRYGMALQTAVTELQLEFCALSSDLAEVTKTKKQIEKFQEEKKQKDRRKLIQEL